MRERDRPSPSRVRGFAATVEAMGGGPLRRCDGCGGHYKTTLPYRGEGLSRHVKVCLYCDNADEWPRVARHARN